MTSDRLLIDGDIIAYHSAFYAEDKDEREAENKINEIIGSILCDCWSSDYTVYLTGTGNFRHEFAKSHTYKGNRKGKPKPVYLGHCRDYMKNKHSAVVSYNEEADDLIAIEAASMGYEGCVVSSTDKDFLQLPCWNFNWRKRGWVKPTEQEATLFLYTQMLTGDRVDNIMGVHLIGPKKAEAFLKGLTTEEELYKMCLKVYEDNGMTEDQLIENARLLYLRRKPGEIWEKPV